MGRIDCSDDMLFEKTESRETKFTGRVFEVEVKTITTPEGAKAHREIVLHNGGAAILPVDSEMNCYFVKQFRSPFEKVMTEAPAGKVEPGEDPLACASREITEETGFTAHKIEHVGKMMATPGYCSEVINLYIATDLEFTGGKLWESEYTDIFVIKYIDDKHLNEVDIYKKAYIDRKLFSKIRSNINYRPKKKTVVQLIFGLKLNIEEANELLNSAGYYLSHSLKSDLIVEWFIINNNYDLDLLFDCLYEYNEKI